MQVTLLDGGLGQELIARTGKATPLWSVQVLIDNPELVGQIHLEYFQAGAEIATANTYSVLPDRLQPHGLEEQLSQLIQIACTQAITARDRFGSGQVAGALGPLGFSYRPEKCPPAEQAAEVYRHICKEQSPYVDLFIAETMASVDQVKGALMGSTGFGKPVWIALTVDDEDGTKLRSGEPIEDLLPVVNQYDVAAVLLNCSTPESVTQGLPLLQQFSRSFGAYANGFSRINNEFNNVHTTVDLLESRDDLSPEAYADFAAQWIDDGASIIGGCCEVGPAHIAELKLRFSK
ncbi:MAG: homocysteine S-methyltransferase family protein [Granulosicoccus sp.]|nr:homocysteine S-methyltransferase family protein [Granulosicoccus sp.]